MTGDTFPNKPLKKTVFILGGILLVYLIAWITSISIIVFSFPDLLNLVITFTIFAFVGFGFFILGIIFLSLLIIQKREMDKIALEKKVLKHKADLIEKLSDLTTTEKVFLTLVLMSTIGCPLIYNMLLFFTDSYLISMTFAPSSLIGLMYLIWQWKNLKGLRWSLKIIVALLQFFIGFLFCSVIILFFPIPIFDPNLIIFLILILIGAGIISNVRFVRKYLRMIKIGAIFCLFLTPLPVIIDRYATNNQLIPSISYNIDFENQDSLIDAVNNYSFASDENWTWISHENFQFFNETHLENEIKRMDYLRNLPFHSWAFHNYHLNYHFSAAHFISLNISYVLDYEHISFDFRNGDSSDFNNYFLSSYDPRFYYLNDTFFMQPSENYTSTLISSGYFIFVYINYGSIGGGEYINQLLILDEELNYLVVYQGTQIIII